jgi:hypothetical protein
MKKKRKERRLADKIKMHVIKYQVTKEEEEEKIRIKIK